MERAARWLHQGNGVQAGVSSLNQFEASFLGTVTVAASGGVTFTFYSDDGWVLGFGPPTGGTAQPAFVSGSRSNPPASTPVKGYPVAGSFNVVSGPATNQVVVSFPTAGTYPLELDYTECCGGQLALTMNASGPAPLVTTSSLPAATQGQTGYSQTLSAQGGTSPITWSLQSGSSLPSGLALSGSGLISGNVAANATATTFTVVATDSTGASSTRQLTLPVNIPPSITTSTMATATQAQTGYTQTLTAIGGTGPLSWSLAGGTLPSALTLSSTGVISGNVVLTASSSTFTVVATDANGVGASQQLTLTVNPYTYPYVTTTSLASATEGQAGYTQTLSAGGGTAPMTWSLQGGSSLPSGLSLSSSGVISGDLAIDAVSTTFAAVVTDVNNASGTRQLTLPVGPYSGRRGSDLLGHGTPGSAAAPPCFQGDPVDCDTGNLVETAPDLQVAGRGRALLLTRTYNSLDAATPSSPRRFGYGWTDTYSASLTLDTSTTPTQAIVHAEDGSTIRFEQAAGGGYAPVGPWVIATFAANPDGTYTYTLPHQATDRFSATGLLLSEGDRDGYLTTMTYNAAGNLIGVTDPAGRARTSTIGTNGLVSAATDPVGRTVAYGYDAARNLSSVTDPSGSVTHYSYDAAHRLTGMTRPSGGTTANVYDSSNRVVSQTDALGHVMTFAYAGSTRTITDPLGDVTVETYLNDLLSTLTKGSGTPLSATWNFGYNIAGQRTSVQDPNGHTSTAAYDRAGNLLTTTDPLGDTTSYTYSALNDLVSVTDPMGHVTTIARDAVGHPLSVGRTRTEDGKVAATTFEYDDAAHPGDVTAFTDPDGKSTTFAYDAAGDLTASTDPLGDKTTTAYNAIGWPISQTSPLGNASGGNPAQHTATVEYDAAGDVIGTTDAAGDTTTTVYDANHNPVRQTDGNGHVTTFVRNLVEAETEVDLPDGSTQKTGYDADGNVVTQIDGLGHSTTYGYDPLHRVVTETDALQRTTSFTYDGVGNRTTVSDPMGRVTTFGYNANNQLTGIAYSDGHTPAVFFTYDPDGRRLSMSDGTGQTTYAFDSLGELAQTSEPAGAVGYSYDLAGRVTGLTYPTQVATVSINGQSVVAVGTVRRTYDAAGRITAVTDWLGNTSQFAYDGDGNMVTESLPNGVTTALTYDNADRLARSTATGPTGTMLDLPYTRDRDGQVTSANPLGTAPGVAQQYTYDPVSRLVASAVPATTASVPSRAFTYDAASHLTGMSMAGTSSTSLSYDIADELISAVTSLGTTTFTSDADGNRSSRTDPGTGLTTYGYDQADHLTSYIGPAMNTANSQISTAAGTAGVQLGPSVIQVDYSYNGDGLRIGKGASGVMSATYVWDLAAGLPVLLQDRTTNYVTDPLGLPLEQIQSTGTVLYYHHDQLGSTRALTDKNGLVVATYTYDPYGNGVGAPPAVANPFQFAGQYKDVETGLYYLRARYYDPATAQFLSRDPLVAKTRSPYGYVYGNPLNGADPSGLDCGIFSPQDCVSAVANKLGGAKDAVANTLGGAKDEVVGIAEHPCLRNPFGGNNDNGGCETELTSGQARTGLGITLGAASVLTGGASLAGASVFGLDATLTGGVAFMSGFGAAGLDVQGCIHGDKVACVGAFLGFGGAMSGEPALLGPFLGIEEGTIPYAVLQGLGAFGWNLGLIGAGSDAVTAWLGGCSN